jgi:ribosome-associated protein
MPTSSTHKSAPAAAPRVVDVGETPIALCQFMKFCGLAESGGAAKQAIGAGLVLLNDTVEMRKRKQLVAGDRVTFAGETLVVGLGDRPPTRTSARH